MTKKIRRLELILEKIEQIMNLRYHKGYGASHPYWEEKQKEMLGQDPFPESEKEETENEKVKISKVFKK